jgi:prophage regulatory protein
MSSSRQRGDMKTVSKKKTPAEAARAAFDPAPPKLSDSPAPSHELRVVLEQPRPPPATLLNRKQVLERVGLTYPTVWLWMQEGRFPRAREIGDRLAWVESEIEKWINDLPIRKFKADAK